MTDREIWDRACRRVEKWNHEWKDGVCTFITPIGDPACVVAMLTWLWERGRITMGEDGVYFNQEDGEFATDWILGPLPLALAAAVNAIPQEEVDAR